MLDRRVRLDRGDRRRRARPGRRPPARCAAGRGATAHTASLSATSAALTASRSAPEADAAGVERSARSGRAARRRARATALARWLGEPAGRCEQRPHARRAAQQPVDRLDLDRRPAAPRATSVAGSVGSAAARARRRLPRAATSARRRRGRPRLPGRRTTAMIPHMAPGYGSACADAGATALGAPLEALGPAPLDGPLGPRSARRPRQAGRHRLASSASAPRPSPARAARCRSGGRAPGPRSPSSASTARDLRPQRVGAVEPVAVGHPHVAQHLGQAGHHRRPARPAGARLRRDDVEQLQAGEQAVAGGGQVAEDHVARLLAAERPAALLQRLEHVAVADLGLDAPRCRARPSPAGTRGWSSR